MRNIKVSIITPVYNVDKYLEECIESILKQDYRNIELILVDDGSTDNSKEIIKRYAKIDNRIKAVFQKNMGAPTARNKGIELATGEYILFFDSDDVLEENIISEMVSKIEQDNADLLIGNFIEIDENSKKLSDKIFFREEKTINDSIIKECSLFQPVPGNKLYKKEIIKNNNLRFADVKIAQDLNFYIKYLLFIKKVTCINKFVYKYRIIQGSISRTYSMKILDITNSFEDVKKLYIKENKIEQYNKYISIVELIGYTSQIKKAIYFKNKKDRKQVIEYFKNKERSIKYVFNLYTLKKIKTFIKFRLIVFFKNIYISNILQKIYLKEVNQK